MVGDKVVGWNPLISSLVTLAEQIEELGIIYIHGKATYIEEVGDA
jgi:hypothetical protein